MTPARRVTQHRDALREPAHRTPSSYIGELFEPQSEGRDPGIRRVKVNTTSEYQPRPPTTHYLLCLLPAIPILTYFTCLTLLIYLTLLEKSSKHYYQAYYQ